MRDVWIGWIGTTLGTFVALEGYGYLRFGADGTLSHWMRYWSTVHPAMPYIMIGTAGSLAYHLWAVK